MDALQQHHGYTRQQPPPPPPPPPHMSDPQRPPQPAAAWYPTQFNYQPSQPPPPPHHSTWPPPHSDHQPIPLPSYQHNSSAPPYPTHPQHHNPYYHPPPPQQQQHMPPPPPPPQYSHPPQPYSQPNPNQSWGNPNWGHHQGWEHPDGINPNNHGEDWAAKARAWAAANAAMENQPQQSQFSLVSRSEEHNHGYHDQYQRVVDPHYTDTQQPSLPASSHQQFQASLGNAQRLPANHLQESSSFSSGPSSCYVSDEHASYTSRDGALSTDPSPTFPYQGFSATNSSVCQQEVPSSYSSVPGKDEVGDRNVHLHTQSPLPVSSALGQYHFQPRLPDSGRSVSSEQRNFTYGDRSAEHMTDPSDRPLEFTPGFYNEYDSHNQPQASYPNPDPSGSIGSVDAVAAMPPVSTLTQPVVSGMFDPSFATPPVPGHAVPMFGQIPVQSFRPPIPTNASFGLGMGTVHPAAAFPGDTNGTNISERPKKAAVPNWLREEIIKKKSVITSSFQDRPEEDSDNPIEDDAIGKSYVRSGLAGSKDINSSRMSDNEDDDEDDIEATRTAAINQEIKRVLTDVLMKVTNDLFDEIATKVLSEDDSTVNVDHNIAPSNHKISSSPPQTPRTSAKVLISVKGKETEADDASEKSSSGLPGDVLGLASYASDDNDETESSTKLATMKMHAAADPQPSSKVSGDVPQAIDNGSSQAPIGELIRANLDRNQNKFSLTEALKNPTVSHKGLGDDVSDEDLDRENSSPTAFKGNISGRVLETKDALNSKDIEGEPIQKPELQGNVVGKKLSTSDASQRRQSGSISDKKDDRVTKNRSVDRDNVRKAEASKVKVDDKLHGSTESRRDERHIRMEKSQKTDDRNGLKDKFKDRGSKHGEKARDSDSRRSSSSKDDKIESEKVNRASLKDDSTRKREHERDEKGDRTKHRTSKDSSRHKRRRSPSVGNRVKSNKDDSVRSHVYDSSDEASEDSRKRKLQSRKQELSQSPTRKSRSRKQSMSPSPTRKPQSRKRSSSPSPNRKLHSRKRNLSPSPARKLHSRKRSLSPSPSRSRRRQVSRSPHSKHSQRRHSPYSSLESTRRIRSKSKSPVRHRR